LRRKFARHAQDFGVTGSQNRATEAKYGEALQSFVQDASTVRVAGEYRETPAILNYNAESGLILIQHPDGAFWSGWRMSSDQLNSVLTNQTIGMK
jgi:hypothetical protein